MIARSVRALLLGAKSGRSVVAARRRAFASSIGSAKALPALTPPSLQRPYHHGGPAHNVQEVRYDDPPRTSLLMGLRDGVGVLHDVLKYFWKHDINICRIESRPKCKDLFDFFVDFDGSRNHVNVRELLQDLEALAVDVLILDEKTVDWFPRTLKELDKVANRTLAAGTDLTSDHPGFADKVYRARRQELADLADSYVICTEIPRVEYTDKETAVWSAVWDRMEPLVEQHACQEYRQAKSVMSYERSKIPQLADVSEILKASTGFMMRPVSGLLSSRDFLNGLAFKVFFCTQYIRHHSRPLYTPEPDILHELLGHAPMFCNADFASFSQSIGQASLGVPDAEIERLARLYWHSVEFGLCKEGDNIKAYGAGLLSSYGELKYSMSDKPKLLPFDPYVACNQKFPITEYQPVYFVAESLQSAKALMLEFCEASPRPFRAFYNADTKSLYIDRPVNRATT